MVIKFCDGCGARVPDGDIAAGTAMQSGEKITCAKCSLPIRSMEVMRQKRPSNRGLSPAEPRPSKAGMAAVPGEPRPSKARMTPASGAPRPSKAGLAPAPGEPRPSKAALKAVAEAAESKPNVASRRAAAPSKKPVAVIAGVVAAALVIIIGVAANGGRSAPAPETTKSDPPLAKTAAPPSTSIVPPPPPKTENLPAFVKQEPEAGEEKAKPTGGLMGSLRPGKVQDDEEMVAMRRDFAARRLEQIKTAYAASSDDPWTYSDQLKDVVRSYRSLPAGEEAAKLLAELKLPDGKRPPPLIGHWKFDEGEGAAAADAVKRAGTMLLKSGAAWTDGKFGKALNLDGSSQYAINETALPMVANGSVTIAVWARPQAAGIIINELNSHVMNQGHFDSHIEVVKGEVRLRVWMLKPVSIGRVEFDKWSHIILRYDGEARVLDGFVNGVKSSSVSNGPRIKPGTLYYALGASNLTHLGSGAFFKGSLDELRIYNGALSDEQAEALFKAE